MFKIIKISTYKQLESYKEMCELQDKYIYSLTKNTELAYKIIDELELQLHHLTAKKLPIKKSKSK